jgi:hypothetical protein
MTYPEKIIFTEDVRTKTPAVIRVTRRNEVAPFATHNSPPEDDTIFVTISWGGLEMAASMTVEQTGEMITVLERALKTRRETFKRDAPEHQW